MEPDEDGRLFEASIEDALLALVERAHYASGGAFGENGHSILPAECEICVPLRRDLRQTLAEAIL